MRFSLFFIITLITNITHATRLDGVRFGIQVKSQDTYFDANKQLGIYRPYAPPFVYEIQVIKKCNNKKDQKLCVVSYEKKFRIILGVYKSKKIAKDKLMRLKEENPKLFENAFVQNIIE